MFFLNILQSPHAFQSHDYCDCRVNTAKSIQKCRTQNCAAASYVNEASQSTHIAYSSLTKNTTSLPILNWDQMPFRYHFCLIKWTTGEYWAKGNPSKTTTNLKKFEKSTPLQVTSFHYTKEEFQT